MDAIRTMTGTLLAAAMAMHATACAAQTVQKCVARNGHARYQSAPCGPGERTAEVWDATPDPVPETDDDLVRVRPRRAGSRSTARRASSRAAALERRLAQATDDRCERARAYRDAVERRAGLDRDYDLLSALQRRVYDACR